MKQILNAIARLLVAAAKTRAELVSRKLAAARLPHQEAYSANAGGWN